MTTSVQRYDIRGIELIIGAAAYTWENAATALLAAVL
jgi:hypothetical protein